MYLLSSFVTFDKQVEYLVSMKQISVTTFDPSNQRLHLEVEEKLSGDMWRGDFQQKYIEDITNKTGCFKKFPVFVKMLLSALKCETESVYIDLLTFQDLEQLKAKKNTSQTSNNSNSNPNNKKRYVILTYVGEFERVHYPLPLNFVEDPEPDVLRRTIERMRNQIMMQRSNTFSVRSEQHVNTYGRIDDFASIEVENQQLRRQITEIE